VGAAATAGASTTHDLTGSWDCCGSGGAAAQIFKITSMDLSSGSFSGTATYPSGTAFSPISGTASGNSVSLTTGPYYGSSYSATFTGTISADNNTMSGTWQSNASQSGTWTATRTSGGGPPVPPPVLGPTVNVAVVSGQVFVKLPGQGFVPLSAARQIPAGSQVDARRGVVRLTSAANTSGAVQSGDFTGAVFQVLQSRRLHGLTDLNLTGGSFRGCVARGGRAAVARRLSSRVVRRLRGSANGRFRTRGRYSAATVRGTIWDTADRCDGTLTRVQRGVVDVRDFRARRNVTVRAGRSYLARAG
jgi:hypothetical protein